MKSDVITASPAVSADQRRRCICTVRGRKIDTGEDTGAEDAGRGGVEERKRILFK